MRRTGFTPRQSPLISCVQGEWQVTVEHLTCRRREPVPRHFTASLASRGTQGVTPWSGSRHTMTEEIFVVVAYHASTLTQDASHANHMCAAGLLAMRVFLKQCPLQLRASAAGHPLAIRRS